MTDWARLMPDVARRLLGEPTRKTAQEWRYGSKGSLAVHVAGERAGTWRDHEAGEGGGVLALIRHKLSCDRAGALRWLELEGRISARSVPNRGNPEKNGPSEPLRAPETARPIPGHRGSGGNRPSEAHGRASSAPRSETTPIARRIVAGSVPAKGTPAARYLSQRGTWPDGEAGELPDAVGWCSREKAPARLPEGAAGVLIWTLTDAATGEPVTDACTCEALTDGGQRLTNRWRRSYGQLTGRCFECGDAAGSVLVLVEGPCDALALARLQLPGVMVRAALSSGPLPALARGWPGEVLACLDGDTAGRSSGAALQTARPDAHVIHGTPGRDPDDWLRSMAAAWGAKIRQPGGVAAIEAVLSDLADPGRILRRRDRRRRKARAMRPWGNTPAGLPDLRRIDRGCARPRT